MRTSSIVWAVIILLIILGGGWYFYSKNMSGEANEYAPAAAGDQSAMQGQSAATDTGASAPMQATVTYDGTSFSPSTVTIAKGGTVTFVDQSNSPMWVASGVHPEHTVYDGTDRATHCAAGYTGPTPFDECQASTANYTFTFDKVGTWPFHNHLNSSATGKITVQ